MSDGRVEVKIEDPAGFEECEVVEVMVGAGASVAEGDVLLEVATDKANMEITAPVAGTVSEILVEEGAVIPTDQVLIVLTP